MSRALQFLLLLLVSGCAPAAGFQIQTAAPVRVDLDDPLVVRFTGVLDAASVTSRSVDLLDGHGKSLPRTAVARGHELLVWLHVDSSLLNSPPERLEVRLAGAPSLHALRDESGALLARATRLEFNCSAVLSPETPEPTRLLALDGQPPSGRMPLSGHRRVLLTYSGGLDPETLTAASFPLVPWSFGVPLQPVLPEVSWTRVGARVDVLLTIPEHEGDLEFNSRRAGVRDQAGREPIPQVLVMLRSPVE